MPPSAQDMHRLRWKFSIENIWSYVQEPYPEWSNACSVLLRNYCRGAFTRQFSDLSAGLLGSLSSFRVRTPRYSGIGEPPLLVSRVEEWLNSKQRLPGYRGIHQVACPCCVLLVVSVQRSVLSFVTYKRTHLATRAVWTGSLVPYPRPQRVVTNEICSRRHIATRQLVGCGFLHDVGALRM